jgi:UDP-galactopyranose mutase
MARVVVIGGGFGGLASAARLAKLGHDVTLLEAAPRLGGALGYVEQDGFRWDAGPTSTLLPAVIRDFFRKSGRPADKEIDLVPVEPASRHRFADGRRRTGRGGRAPVGRLRRRLRRGLGGAAQGLVRAPVVRGAREQGRPRPPLHPADAAQAGQP